MDYIALLRSFLLSGLRLQSSVGYFIMAYASTDGPELKAGQLKSLCDITCYTFFLDVTVL